MCNNPNLNNQQYQDGINNDFTSLPCETFLMASRVNSGNANEDDDFSYKNPMYQSAHVQVKSKPIVNDEETYHVENSEEGKGKHDDIFACFIPCFASENHLIILNNFLIVIN